MTAPWDRQLWGVMLGDGTPADKPILLGSRWYGEPITFRQDSYPGEPSRALLFLTRSDARAWCAKQNRQWRERSDFMKHWRVWAVRVHEKVEVTR